MKIKCNFIYEVPQKHSDFLKEIKVSKKQIEIGVMQELIEILKSEFEENSISGIKAKIMKEKDNE
jgi:hypothetical protein